MNWDKKYREVFFIRSVLYQRFDCIQLSVPLHVYSGTITKMMTILGQSGGFLY